MASINGLPSVSSMLNQERAQIKTNLNRFESVQQGAKQQGAQAIRLIMQPQVDPMVGTRLDISV